MNKWISIGLAILLFAAIFLLIRIAGQSDKTTGIIDSQTPNTQTEQDSTVDASFPNTSDDRAASSDTSPDSATEEPGESTPVNKRRLRIEEERDGLPVLDPNTIREANSTSGSPSGSTKMSATGSNGLQPAIPNPGTGQPGDGEQFIDMNLTPIDPGDFDEGPGEGIRIPPGPGPGEGFQGVPGPGPGEGFQGVPGPGPGENDFGVPGPGPGEGEPGVPGPGPGEDESSGNEQAQDN